jgi:hypothetical protein
MSGLELEKSSWSRNASRRLIRLDAPFNVEESNRDDLKEFSEFSLAVFEADTEISAAELAQRKARFRKFKAVERVVSPIVRDVFADKISPADAAEQVRKLKLDDALLRELFDNYSKATTTTDGQRKEAREELRKTGKDIQRRAKLLEASRQASEALEILTRTALAGDTDAARDLAKHAIAAVGFLDMLRQKCPEAVRAIARQEFNWPVLLDADGNWKNSLPQNFGDLGLGSETWSLRCKFREARGADENHPSRVWAKCAVRAIEETRLRCCIFRFKDAVKKVVVEQRRWGLGPIPDWVTKAMGLPPFSNEPDALKHWASLIRFMIREQMPNFETHPHWKNQRNTARAAGRTTKGVIQNRILDDITDALKTIAPSPLGQTCRNSSTEFPQPKSGF